MTIIKYAVPGNSEKNRFGPNSFLGGKGVGSRRDPDGETLKYEPTRGRICSEKKGENR